MDDDMTRTNIQVMEPSRTQIKPGDVFAMRLPSEQHLFGRVIEVDIPSGRAPMPGANLVYVYQNLSPSRDPDVGSLTPDNLLIPPLFINRLPSDI